MTQMHLNKQAPYSEVHPITGEGAAYEQNGFQFRSDYSRIFRAGEAVPPPVADGEPEPEHDDGAYAPTPPRAINTKDGGRKIVGKEPKRKIVVGRKDPGAEKVLSAREEASANAADGGRKPAKAAKGATDKAAAAAPAKFDTNAWARGKVKAPFAKVQAAIREQLGVDVHDEEAAKKALITAGEIEANEVAI